MPRWPTVDTVFRPELAKAMLQADGEVARRFPPVVTGQLDASPADLAYLRDALRGVIERGTARKAFAGFPGRDGAHRRQDGHR